MEGGSHSKIAKIKPIKIEATANTITKMLYTTASWDPVERNKIPPSIDGTIDMKEALPREKILRYRKSIQE